MSHDRDTGNTMAQASGEGGMVAIIMSGTLALCLAAALVSGAEKTLMLTGGGRVSAKVEGEHVQLLIQGVPNAASRVSLKLDDTVAPSTPALRLLGEIGGKVLILEDSSYSRPGGLSECKAGKERFLRVIVFRHPNREALSVKLASCRGNLEFAGEGVVGKLAREQ